MNIKVTKSGYLKGFICVVVVLAVTRCVYPDIAKPPLMYADVDAAAVDTMRVENSDSISENAVAEDPKVEEGKFKGKRTKFYNPDGSLVRNRIYSVPGFQNSFPDNNDVQLSAANKYGVSPVKDRKEAEHRMKELVYVGANPFFHVDRLDNSIPYLVPRASVLLQDIGRAFFDSLTIKGIPLHKIIVTSVLRTKDDVARLRNRNGNATENSCHLYGTTFDICYNRYKTVEDPEGPSRYKVRNDTLKWVLSEVLRDFREQNRCYIKYEVKQGCFHMTVN